MPPGRWLRVRENNATIPPEQTITHSRHTSDTVARQALAMGSIMNTATTLFRMLSSGRVQPSPDERDPAEMGTCFGLELSFEAEARSAHDAPGERKAADGAAPHWWQRLSPRRAASA